MKIFINKFEPSLSKEGLELYNYINNLYPHYINGKSRSFSPEMPYTIITENENSIEELISKGYLTLKDDTYYFNEEGVSKKI